MVKVVSSNPIPTLGVGRPDYSQSIQPSLAAAVFKSGGFVSGQEGCVVWTPAQGKRFRLLGYEINISNDVAEAAADLGVNVFDEGTIICSHACLIPAASVKTVAGATRFSVNLPINGYLSSMPNNRLRIFTFSGNNLTAGGINMIAWGTEE